jgi:Na+/phosphate symporter
MSVGHKKPTVQARPIFRLGASVLAILMIGMGLLALFTGHSSSYKFGGAALGFGIIFLVVAIRGRLF